MKTPIMSRSLPIAAAVLAAAAPLTAAHAMDGHLQADTQKAQQSTQCITEQEVIKAQKAWGDGIVKIGQIYSDGGDYRAAAADHINTFYGYDINQVLFKPTLARDAQFRLTFDGALSYFVGDNPSYPEDKGFAIAPWSAVRWQNAGITNNVCGMAIAMGNYFFTPAEGGEETKVEYTIGYVKDDAGDLRMIVHKSTIPFDGTPNS